MHHKACILYGTAAVPTFVIRDKRKNVAGSFNHKTNSISYYPNTFLKYQAISSDDSIILDSSFTIMHELMHSMRIMSIPGNYHFNIYKHVMEMDCNGRTCVFIKNNIDYFIDMVNCELSVPVNKEKIIQFIFDKWFYRVLRKYKDTDFEQKNLVKENKDMELILSKMDDMIDVYSIDIPSTSIFNPNPKFSLTQNNL